VQRFPRFTGRWRDDKAPTDATTVTEAVGMYRPGRQATRRHQAGGRRGQAHAAAATTQLVLAARADRSGTRHTAGGITSQTLTATTARIIAAESAPAVASAKRYRRPGPRRPPPAPQDTLVSAERDRTGVHSPTLADAGPGQQVGGVVVVQPC
jgi:hypothetical protein